MSAVPKSDVLEAANAVETPDDKFNHTIPEDHFPPHGMPARAAKATVDSEAWTNWLAMDLSFGPHHN